MKTFVATAAVIIGAFGTSAHAGPEVEVKIKGHLLETQQGQYQVYETLESKARQICRKDAAVTGRRLTASSCQRALLASFVADLNHDKITTLHQLNTDYRLAGK